MSLNLKKINEKLFQFKTDNNLLKDESKLFKTKLLKN